MIFLKRRHWNWTNFNSKFWLDLQESAIHGHHLYQFIVPPAKTVLCDDTTNALALFKFRNQQGKKRGEEMKKKKNMTDWRRKGVRVQYSERLSRLYQLLIVVVENHRDDDGRLTYSQNDEYNRTRGYPESRKFWNLNTTINLKEFSSNERGKEKSSWSE